MISILPLAKTTPVIPPHVNKSMNPIAKYKGVTILITPPAKVNIQLKIFIPVGIAIDIVAVE